MSEPSESDYLQEELLHCRELNLGLVNENLKLKKSFEQSEDARKQWLQEFDRLKLSNVRMKEALLDVNTMFASGRNPDTLTNDELETWRSVQEALEITERKKK